MSVCCRSFSRISRLSISSMRVGVPADVAPGWGRLVPSVHRHIVHISSFNLTAYVVAVICVATLIRSTFGFGEALVAVPLLALRTPVEVAAPLAVLVSIVVAGVVVVQDRRGIEFRAAAGLILSSLFGIPLGLLLLTHADDRVIKLLLGSVIMAFSLYSLGIKAGRTLSHDHVGWLMVCG